MFRTCCWLTMSWSLSAVGPGSSAFIFDTETAPMTTSARTIAPNARPRRYASRRLLKRNMFPPGKAEVDSGAPGKRARRRSGHRLLRRGIECFTSLSGAVFSVRTRPERVTTARGRSSWSGGMALRLLQAELPDEALELLGGAGQLLRRRGDLLRRGARLLRGGRHLLRRGRGLLGDGGDLGHVGLDLLRARRDLLDRGGDLLDAAVHVGDRVAERQERLAGLLDRRDPVLGATGAVLDDLDGLGGLALDLADERGDRGGRRLALLGQLADLLGDHGEAAALLAGARGLDGRVQRQQVRLLRDAGDRGHDALDLTRLRAQLADRLRRVQRAVTHRAHGLGGLRHGAGALLGDLTGAQRRGRGLLRVGRAQPAGRRHLLGGALGLLDRAGLALGALGALAHGRRDLADGTAGLLGRRRHLLRGSRQRLRRRGDVADELAQLGARGVVALDRLDRLGLDLVEGTGHVADLVAGRVLDLRRLRLDRLGQVARGHRRDGLGEAGDADVAQHAEALDDDLQRAHDRGDDEERQADGDQRGEDRRDEDAVAATVGGRVRGGGRDLDLAVDLALERVAGLRHGRLGRDDLARVVVTREVALLDVLDGLRARARDGRLVRRGEADAGGVEGVDETLGGRLVGRGAQALHVGVAGLAQRGDLLGHGVLGGELAVVDVEVARRQVRRALHVLLDVEDVLQRDHVVLTQVARALVKGVHLRHGDRADDRQGQDHRAEREAEAIRQPKVVETGHASSRKAAVEDRGPPQRTPRRPGQQQRRAKIERFRGRS